MNIIIGADLVPTQKNNHRFLSPESAEIASQDILRILESADYRIFNCEIPLAKGGQPIDKFGPNLKADPDCIRGFVALGTDFLTLANNHMMDFGTEALHETLQTVAAAGISYSGVGDTVEEAQTLFTTHIGNKTVGIYCCVEHEFSVATHLSAGANPFDPLYSLGHIQELREQCDLVIVLYHGGRELYQYPTPKLQERCRRMVDYGADLVLCQHSHCIGAKEMYKGKEILYGQGNFIFDRTDNPITKEGLLVKVIFDNKGINIEHIPVIVKNGFAELAIDEKRQEILNGFENRSKYIESPDNVQKKFDELCNSVMSNYLFAFRGGSIIAKIINKLTHGSYVKRIYKDKKALQILNNIQCETLQEVSTRSLELAANRK